MTALSIELFRTTFSFLVSLGKNRFIMGKIGDHSQSGDAQ
jgi:hypothetical protein